jgi:two-component system LytT family response regulator
MTDQHRDTAIEVSMGVHRCKLAIEDVVSISTAGNNYLDVRCYGATYLVRASLRSMAQSLEPAGFLRVHKSHLVNARRVNAIQAANDGGYLLTLDDGSQLMGEARFKDSMKRLPAFSMALS